MKGTLSLFVISVFFVIAKELLMQAECVRTWKHLPDASYEHNSDRPKPITIKFNAKIGTPKQNIGQCPSIDVKSLITSCDGSKKDGPAVFADFFKIKRPCTCIVTPSFVGELLVTSKKVIISSCNTRVSVSSGIIFGCPLSSVSSKTFVKINQTVNVQAEYIPPSTTGTFYHCVGFQQNGGLNGNVSVKCEPPANTTTSTIPTTTSTIPQLSHGTSSTESSISVVNANKNANITISIKMTTANYPLPVESAQNTSEITIYIIACSAAGGALILVCLIIITIVLMNRSRSEGNKNRSLEANMAHTNEVFDINTELPDNPLYLSSQPLHELGYSSDQEKQHDLPPTDSKSETKIISNYDVPPNKKPIDNNESSMPVYAVPKKGKVRTPAVSTGDVYAHVCKSEALRKFRYETMKIENDTAVAKLSNTDDKDELTKSTCYAEKKCP